MTPPPASSTLWRLRPQAHLQTGRALFRVHWMPLSRMGRSFFFTLVRTCGRTAAFVSRTGTCPQTARFHQTEPRTPATFVPSVTHSCCTDATHTWPAPIRGGPQCPGARDAKAQQLNGARTDPARWGPFFKGRRWRKIYSSIGGHDGEFGQLPPLRWLDLSTASATADRRVPGLRVVVFNGAGAAATGAAREGEAAAIASSSTATWEGRRRDIDADRHRSGR